MARIAFVSTVLAFYGATLPAAAQAMSQAYRVAIPREALDVALKDLAHQTSLQIGRLSDSPGDTALVGPLSGEMSLDQALHSLLAPSGLTYKVVNDHTIAIVSVESLQTFAGSAHSATARQSAPNGGQEHKEGQKEGKRNSSDPFRLAQPDQRLSPQSAALETRNDSNSRGDSGSPIRLEEIVVTAQKRTERLQDVPVPVTAIDAQSLTDTNQFRLQDYFASVPGLSFAQDIHGSGSLSIRGLTTGADVTPATGITIDDVPFGSSAVGTDASPAPDVDPNELARIEVLRGPQGTLYGASSIGGLVKYVTIDPSTEGLSGRLQVGTEGIRNGDGAGYAVSGAANVPLTDTVAIRASGFAHQDPGYIDNVLTGRQGANKSRTDGGRLSGLWRPAESFTLKLSALIQDSRSDGSALADFRPGFADLQQSFLGGLGGYDRKIQAYTANLSGNIGSATVTSLTGYGKSDVSGSIDETSIQGGLEALFKVGGVGAVEHNTNEKLSQELRLAMPLGERLDWLLGGFYTHERVAQESGYVLVDPVTFERGTEVEAAQATLTYAEYAAFTDLTFKLTDAFDVQLGGRESHNRQTVNTAVSGPLISFAYGTSLLQFPPADSSGNSFTYLVTPRYRFGPDLMAYARFASGYRPGGPNLDSALDPKVAPKAFAPDKTQNYELGAKGEFLDHRLSLDASLFYILWRDIQLSVVDLATGIPYDVNASRAKSEGAELSLTAKPLTGLTLSSWVVFNEAELTQPFGIPGLATASAAGDPLPYSSRFSAYVSATQEFPLWGEVRGFAGASLSYVGARESEFTGTSLRESLPAYAKTDMQLGVRSGQWLGMVFMTNAMDRRGYLDGGLGGVYPTSFHIIQPRTVGLNVSRKF